MADESVSAGIAIQEGAVWILDARSLCAKIEADYLYITDGDLWAGIAGRGEFLVRDLLGIAEALERPKLASVKPIK